MWTTCCVGHYIVRKEMFMTIFQHGDCSIFFLDLPSLEFVSSFLTDKITGLCLSIVRVAFNGGLVFLLMESPSTKVPVPLDSLRHA